MAQTCDSSPAELNTPSPIDELLLLEPSILSNNIPPLTNGTTTAGTMGNIFHKCSIHHQDAQASIADATDCLRMISGKMDWFFRKQQFCPHLISIEDAKQIALLQQKIVVEEIPFLDLQQRLRNGLDVDVPRELEGKISNVCGQFIQLKQRMDNLITTITPIITTPHTTPTTPTSNTVAAPPATAAVVEPVQ